MTFELLAAHEATRVSLFAYFGYCEDWRVFPVNDQTDCFWRLYGEGPGSVRFADSMEDLNSNGDYYTNEIYTQRHLPKWVYRGPDYTMIVVDTHTDGNKFLQIFDNAKQQPLLESQ